MHGPTVRSRRSQARLARTLLALAIAALAVVIPASAASPLAPPSTPTALAASAGQVSIALSWNASTDNVGVAGYGVYRGGTSMGSTPTTSFTFTGLTCGTSYALGVDAFDAAGNRSARATQTVS